MKSEGWKEFGDGKGALNLTLSQVLGAPSELKDPCSTATLGLYPRGKYTLEARLHHTRVTLEIASSLRSHSVVSEETRFSGLLICHKG